MSDLVPLLDMLCERPFGGRAPDVAGLGLHSVHALPEAWLVVLARSGPFWDDDDGSASIRAGEEMAAREQAALAEVIEAWGLPEDFCTNQLMTRPEPPAIATTLADLGSGEGASWRRHGRLVVLTVGQVDKEWEMEVVAAIAPEPARG